MTVHCLNIPLHGITSASISSSASFLFLYLTKHIESKAKTSAEAFGQEMATTM
jgi:hypothetical protein